MCCIVELARATIYGYELAVYHPQQLDACNIIKLKTSFRQIFICFKHDEIQYVEYYGTWMAFVS